MASVVAVALAFLVHVLTRVSIFFSQPFYQCSAAPNVASWIYLFATLIIILDNDIFPPSYRKLPVPCQCFVEFVICLLLTEFSTIIIWCSVEKTVFNLLKCILLEKYSDMYFDMGGDRLVGFLLVLGSMFILYNAFVATDYYYLMRKRIIMAWYDVVSSAKKIWGSGSDTSVNRLTANADTVEADTDDGLIYPIKARPTYCPPLPTHTPRTRRRRS